MLILPWIWPSSKKRNDIYHKSQVLISHALAFHAALRVSPHCSSIILKWMSGKGCHVVNLGRLFSFHRYIILMPTYCSSPYLFKATSQTSLRCLAQSKQHLWYRNSEFLLVGRPGGWEAAVDGEIPWLGNQNPCPWFLYESNASLQCLELSFFSVCISPAVLWWTKGNLMVGCYSLCCLRVCSHHLSCQL